MGETKDALGDRMKLYEASETSRVFDGSLPIYARIDGRSFSTFTRDFERPFDIRMTTAMVETTKRLVEKTHALIGYTQSDEISLAWICDKPESQPLFGGKVHKLTSVLASLATAAFADEIRSGFDQGLNLQGRLPHFDARVFQLPSKSEVANAFLWRTNDAEKNAISQVCRAYYSAKQIHKKNSGEMLTLLYEKGVDFYNISACFRAGTFVQRKPVERTLTKEERERIPENHRPPVDMVVTRHAIQVLPIFCFRGVSNRVEVIFDGAEPR